MSDTAKDTLPFKALVAASAMSLSGRCALPSFTSISLAIPHTPATDFAAFSAAIYLRKN